MGIKERRDIEKTEMKRKIMDAVMELIEEEGYEKLSIRKIAAKIEYSPTTIYLYYKDKAEIIKDMSEVLYSKVINAVRPVINEDTVLSVVEQIRDSMCIFIQVLCSEHEMAKAIMFSGRNVIFADNLAEGETSNAGIQMLDRLILKGIERQVLRPAIENTSWMIISALIGFVMSALTNQLYLQEDFNLRVNDFVMLLMVGMQQ